MIDVGILGKKKTNLETLTSTACLTSRQEALSSEEKFTRTKRVCSKVFDRIHAA